GRHRELRLRRAGARRERRVDELHDRRDREERELQAVDDGDVLLPLSPPQHGGGERGQRLLAEEDDHGQLKAKEATRTDRTGSSASLPGSPASRGCRAGT